MMAQRPIQQVTLPSAAEVRRLRAEAEEERRRVAYQSGRLAELFGQVLDVIGGRRRKTDVDQRDDQ